MRRIACLAILVSLVSCVKKNPDQKFDTFKASFISALWKQYPNWASSVGYHKYDDRLTIQDDAFRKQELGFCSIYLDSLQNWKPEELNANNRTDYYIIENQLKYQQWQNKELRQYEWDPSMYNVGEGFANILGENYDNLENRLHGISKRLENVHAYYEAAKKNIKLPTVEHTDLAIAQNQGALDVLGKMLNDSVSNSKLPANEKKEILDKAEKAKIEVQAYIDLLVGSIRPKLITEKPKSFRLGKELYAKKFEFEIQSSLTAEQMYNKAVARKTEVQHEMVRISKQLWHKYFGKTTMPSDSLHLVRMMIDTLSAEHVKPENFMASIKSQLPQLTAFITKKNLLFIDPKKPLVVRETPAYMQGIAGASINAPGPYDKNANTYYNVTPLTNYKPAQAESWLREYNKYILQILNIHEAIPGHYTQLVYSNNSPSLIKSIFGNGATVEGWAVYSERMMLEEGYGGNDPAMWLMYYKWHLRTVCNTILDYSVHNLDMSEGDALNFLMYEAFQQEAEAKGKWRRVTLSQVQLCSYFSGFSEIYSLREELKQKEGDKFNLKAFHEKFLSYGSAPVKYIRELMLTDKAN
jgi:uncharacterized protein (DUF885 family)